MTNAKRYCLNNYTVQCRDEISGDTGCFLFDTARWEQGGKFYAVSPVFTDLVAFYAGTTDEQRKGQYIEFKGEQVA